MCFTQTIKIYAKSYEDNSEFLSKISTHGLRHTHTIIQLLKVKNIKVVS